MDGLPVARVENEQRLNGNGTERKRERNGTAHSVLRTVNGNFFDAYCSMDSFLFKTVHGLCKNTIIHSSSPLQINSFAVMRNYIAHRYVRGHAFIGNNASWGHSLLCLANSIY